MNEESGSVDPVAAYNQAEDFITGLIMGPPSPPPESTPTDIRQRAIGRVDRLRSFLEFLGNPHLAYPTIHIGGTSGKGSTTSLVASILTASGLRTGSHVSPYLQVSTEKLLIDGEPASGAQFLDLVQFMQGRIDEWVDLGNPMPLYGELWVAMTFVYFAQEKVDIGVIEVGAGGRFDLTNVVQPVAAAITSIGFDHTVTLGNTLPEIAWHKAGIIKPGAAALTSVTALEALEVIQAEADEVGVELQRVAEGTTYSDVETSREGTSFLDIASGKRFQVPLIGTFQASNAALAMAVTRSIGDDRITDQTISAGLASARFPGRMEIVQERPLVVLDGAHNPEKIGGMAANIGHITANRRTIVVFGVLESKNYAEMWDELRPIASELVATAPQVLAKPPVAASDIGDLAGPDMTVHVIDDPIEAIRHALAIAGPDDAILVTGSLYLVGNIREHWFPTEHILKQGTSWPE